MPGTRKLGRPTDHRRAMLRAMVTYLLENGKIETTVTRAKEVRPLAEKMITLGKKGDLNAKRAAMTLSPRKTWSRRSSTKSPPSMPIVTAVMSASPASVPVAATAPRWLSSSWSNFH